MGGALTQPDCTILSRPVPAPSSIWKIIAGGSASSVTRPSIVGCRSAPDSERIVLDPRLPDCVLALDRRGLCWILDFQIVLGPRLREDCAGSQMSRSWSAPDLERIVLDPRLPDGVLPWTGVDCAESQISRSCAALD